MPKSKPEVKVMAEVRAQPPTPAQLAAWARAWRLLAAMPMPLAAAPAQAHKGEGEVTDNPKKYESQ